MATFGCSVGPLHSSILLTQTQTDAHAFPVGQTVSSRRNSSRLWRYFLASVTQWLSSLVRLLKTGPPCSARQQPTMDTDGWHCQLFPFRRRRSAHFFRQRHLIVTGHLRQCAWIFIERWTLFDRLTSGPVVRPFWVPWIVSVRAGSTSSLGCPSKNKLLNFSCATLPFCYLVCQ